MRRSLIHPEVQKQLPIALLAGSIIIISMVDWFSNLEEWMAVPLQVESAWNALLAGEVSGSILQTLSTTVSCAFLHADIEHLLGNMLFFWIFGSVVLEICGWRWMLAIFFMTAIGASVGHILMEHGSPIPMLGASGTVMGFEGAYLGLVVRKQRPNPHVWPMARPISPGELAAVGIIGVVLDLMGIVEQSPESSTAYGAHVGGFVTGIVVSFLRKD